MTEKNTKEKKMYEEIYKVYPVNEYFELIEKNPQNAIGHPTSARSKVSKVIRNSFRKYFGNNICWKELTQLEKDIFIYIVLWDNQTFRTHVKSFCPEDFSGIEEFVKEKRNSLASDFSNQTLDFISELFIIRKNDSHELTSHKYKRFKAYLERYNNQYPSTIPIPCISEEGWRRFVANKPCTVIDYVNDYNDNWNNIFEKYIDLLSITQFIISNSKSEKDARVLIEQRTGIQFIEDFDKIWNVVQNLSKPNYDSKKLSSAVYNEISKIFPYENEIYNLMSYAKSFVTEEEVDHIAIRVLIKALSEQLHISINRDEIKKTLRGIKAFQAYKTEAYSLDTTMKADRAYILDKAKLESLDFYKILSEEEISSSSKDLYTDWFTLFESILYEEET